MCRECVKHSQCVGSTAYTDRIRWESELIVRGPRSNFHTEVEERNVRVHRSMKRQIRSVHVLSVAMCDALRSISLRRLTRKYSLFHSCERHLPHEYSHRGNISRTNRSIRPLLHSCASNVFVRCYCALLLPDFFSLPIRSFVFR